MNNQYFQTLLAKRGKFLGGENPSPSKLTAINAQIESAFSVIESFLGNGTDYLINNDAQRRVLPNISSAIGVGEKIYKPVNKIKSVESLQTTLFTGGNCSYNPSTKILTVTDSITFNSVVGTSDVFGICYKASSDIDVAFNGSNKDTFAASPSEWTWRWLPVGYSATNITLSSAASFTIISAAISNISDSITPKDYWEKITANGKYVVSNIAYSIPLTNNKKFYIKTPCYYSNPSVSVPTADRCSVKTCNYCIGNTHEFDDASPDFGMPKCDGATSQTGRAISYTPDLLTGRSEFKTIQSPLLTIDNPYTVKLMPFKFYHGNATGSVLPENQMILYDKTNNSMPVIKNIQYQSASAERGDIMYFADRDDVSDSDTADRYLLTNGAYGLSNMIWDIIQLLKA